jgi:two-component system sensor histidine kinase DegS
MTEAPQAQEISPREAFIANCHRELDQARSKLKEITLLVEQSQGEVDKLAQRNASATAELHQMQAHFDTIPREDIRSAYELAQDAQQRLFTMRGQLEKLQSDKIHLQRYAEHLASTLQLLEGGAEVAAVTEEESGSLTVIEQVIEAQEEERRKISRQMHDGPAQSMANFILQTEIAMRLFDTNLEGAKQELAALKESANNSFSRVRDFIFDLRPMMLDDLGLVPTVRRYIEALKEKTGINMTLVVTGTERRIEPYREVLVFRTVQQLLGNVRDHAQATQAKISLDMDDHQVRLAVEDNGKGIDPKLLDSDEGEGRSLAILQERVSQLGGTMDLEGSATEGTRVALAIPTGD